MHRSALIAAAMLAAAVGARAQTADPVQRQVEEAAGSLARGETQTALGLYSDVLKDAALTSDRRAQLLNDRGVAYARARHPRLAVEDFNRAVQLAPELASVYNNRGNVLLSLGQTKEAIKDFDRAIVLAPGYAAAFSNRATARMKLDQVAGAIEDYTRAITLTPTSAAPLAGRGRAYLTQDRPYAAMRDFSRALQSDVRFASAYIARAEAKLAVERQDEAVEDLSRAIVFDPVNADIYVQRGNAYMLARNQSSAVKDFAKAIELNSKLVPAYLGRALALAHAEAFEDAKSDLANALEIDPRSADAYAIRAYVYKLTQQPELGAKEIAKALKLDSGRPLVEWVKGEIDEALGKPDEAIASYRKALAAKPTLREAAEALDRLGAARDNGAETTLPDGRLDGWTIVVKSGRYYARLAEQPKLRVPLEMLGEGQPRLLAWDVKKAPLNGIGTLRYWAGKAGQNDIEQVAIVDLTAASVVSVQLHRQGQSVSNWTWDENKVVVASIDGVTEELNLRPKQDPAVASASAAPRRVSDPNRTANGAPGWAPWGTSSGWNDPRGRPRSKPKNFFELLFGN